MDDLDLLGEYARSGSQEAFARVAERYTGLIYSAALRQVRDVHAAEDVTQAVLMVLMKKAGRLPRGTILAAWLLKATRYVALDAVKLNARREFHERQAGMAKAERVAGGSPASGWEQIAPVVDEALLALGSGDRDALVLRYWMDKSAEGIAQELGVSAATARKRVSRALARLRSILARRGVLTEEAVLGAALGSQAIARAPAPAAIVVRSLQAVSETSTSSVLARAAARTMGVARAKLLLATVAVAAVVSGSGGAAIWGLWPRSPIARVQVRGSVGRTLVHPGAGVFRAALSIDGQLAMTGGGSIFGGNRSADSDVRLWNLQSGAEVGRMAGHQGRIFDLVFRPGGSEALSASDDGTARLWDLKSGRQVRQFDAGLPITSMDVSPDGRWLLTGARVLTAAQYGAIADRTAPRLGLWDIDSGEMVQAFSAIGQGVAKVAFSPDGQKIAAALDPSPARVVICRPDGGQMRRLGVGNGTVTSLTFSPDGACVAAGCKDGSVYVWDARRGVRTALWHLQRMEILAMAFSPDGRMLVTGGGVSQSQRAVTATESVGPIHIFDAQDGREIGQLSGHTGNVFSLHFGADGRRLLSAGGQSVFLWNLAVERK